MKKRGESSLARERGFTLVELLIVIAVIGILAGLALKAVGVVRENTDAALTSTLVSQLQTAIESYYQDEGLYPGQGQKSVDEETNQFPLVYLALFDDPAPNGKGGRNAPYLQLKEDSVVVYDEDSGQYRKAKRSERNDPDVDKFIIDAIGGPLVYRCNKGRRRKDYMHNTSSFDIYSVGLDEQDQTKLGLDEENDDLGNW